MKGAVLTLPGWQGSGAGHWQSRWEAVHADRRVEQHDWLTPQRGDWTARLDEVVLTQPEPVWLAAHSLGCHLVAAWAAHTQHAQRVRGALLVAPPDLETADILAFLRSWRPIIRQKLPFTSTVLASTNDDYCRLDRAAEMAQSWGATFMPVGPLGHLNADSGLGDWPEGRALLHALEPN